MFNRDLRGEDGMAMISVAILVTVLMSLSMTFAYVSIHSLESSKRDETIVRARLAAEQGLHMAVAEILKGIDADGDGLGTLFRDLGDGRTIAVTGSDLGDNLFRLVSKATLPRATFAAESIVERYFEPIVMNSPGALAAQGRIEIEESAAVLDGRDWDATGTTVIGPGVPAAFTVSDYIDLSTQAMVGGAGMAPAFPPPPGTVVQFGSLADGIDDDGDGAIDEEAFDGIDNDLDGSIDEDINSFPTSPDVALHLPPDTLKTIAQSQGTYFTSVTQIEAYLLANGGNVPGGVVLYADFAEDWRPARLGEIMNTEPSIIVFHDSTSRADLRELSGRFKGLIFADDFRTMDLELETDKFELIGALLSFYRIEIESEAPGGATIKYSSEVLNNLPALGGQPHIRRLTWHRVSANL